jgi:hypothetical protein
MTNYKVNVIYIIEANSKLHAEMIVKQHLKGKGEVEKTEDYFGYDEIKVIEHEKDNN